MIAGLLERCETTERRPCAPEASELPASTLKPQTNADCRRQGRQGGECSAVHPLTSNTHTWRNSKHKAGAWCMGLSFTLKGGGARPGPPSQQPASHAWRAARGRACHINPSGPLQSIRGAPRTRVSWNSNKQKPAVGRPGHLIVYACASRGQRCRGGGGCRLPET